MPENPQALFQLAKILYQRGNFDGAREYLKNVTCTGDPSAEVFVVCTCGSNVALVTILPRAVWRTVAAQVPDSPEYQELLRGNFE